MEQFSSVLLESLQKVVAGLADPANHYMVSANYYVHVNPGHSSNDRWYMAVMYLHREAAWNVALDPDGMLMDVILNREEPEEKSRIKIPYEEIWRVQEGHAPAFTDENQIFYDPEVFKKLLSYTPGR